MAHKKTLWSRIGQFMNPFQRDETLPKLTQVDVGPVCADDTPSARSPKGGNRLSTWRRRDHAIDELRRGYDQVLDLIASIEGHLERHNDRSEKVDSLLSELARGVQQLPRATHQQADTLNRLAGHMETSNNHSRHIIGVLGELPEATRAQLETLRSVAQQVDASTQATQRLCERLDSLGQLVQTLSHSSQEHVLTLKQVQRATTEQQHSLTGLLDEQGRRFSILLVLTLVLAVIAVAIAGIGLFS